MDSPMTTTIPVIDLSSTQSEEEIVAALMNSCQTIGFATLVNHGVSQDCMAKAFQASQSFFSLPADTKLKYPYQGSESNRGYIAIGREAQNLVETVEGINNDTITPLKESLEIGTEREEGYRNEWPEELENTTFKKDLLEYFDQLDALNLRIMRWIAIGLKLDDPNFLVDRCNEQHENLRLLHYPSYSSSSRDSSRANLHTDYGTITLLAQDSVGGLQVLNQEGSSTWIDVLPQPNAIVMNVGEMLMRWSNNVLKATLHRVVAPKVKENVPERYSIAFFCNPNKSTLLECLDSPLCRKSTNQYDPIQAHEYITQRLSDTIKDPVVELGK